MSEQKLAPIHPREILLEESLEPMGISQYRLAKDISVPARRINEIVHGARTISPDTAVAVFWSVGAFLDESTGPVQPGSGEGSPEGPIGERSAGACDVVALYS